MAKSQSYFLCTAGKEAALSQKDLLQPYSICSHAELMAECMDWVATWQWTRSVYTVSYLYTQAFLPTQFLPHFMFNIE